MIFLGAFFGADELSLSVTPTNIQNITSLTVYDTKLDTLYVTENPDFEIEEEIPSEWDFDTVMYASYDEDTDGSNIRWTLDTVSHLIVKRKLIDEFMWTTILVKPINTIDDFSISEIDPTPTTGKYVYAVIPALNGVEGGYVTTNVDVEVTRLTLSDGTETWSTVFTNGNVSITWSTPGNFLTTLQSKYPTYVSNTIANYQTIQVTGEFYPTEDYCNMDLMLDDYERTKYLNEFLTFLNNRKAKILKTIDGRRWLVMVNDGVTDNTKDFYKEREISFSCTEIGNSDSTEDLTENGLLEVPIAYW